MITSLLQVAKFSKLEFVFSKLEFVFSKLEFVFSKLEFVFGVYQIMVANIIRNVSATVVNRLAASCELHAGLISCFINLQ